MGDGEGERTPDAADRSPDRQRASRALERAIEAAEAFRERYVADRAAGRILPVDEYAALFPGFEDIVRDQHRILRDEDPPVRIPADASGTLDALLRSGPRPVAPTREIARGGMGAVYLLRDAILNRDLAMKVILDDRARIRPDRTGPDAPTIKPVTSLRRMLQEAQVTAQLAHPGIVPVHDLGIDPEGRLFFTMKLVRGRTLREVFRLAADGKEGWTRTRALQVLLRICETIAFAHSKGVLHRDLKPSNVMVGGFGEVYVMDWGLAKVLDPASRGSDPLSLAGDSPDPAGAGSAAAAPLTRVGDVLGTPEYMPPEQAHGDVDRMDRRSDVYALGAMLYELLTGLAPYAIPDTPQEANAILRKILSHPPEDVAIQAPDVPGELAAICRKAMARDRDGRYQTALEMAEDLHSFLDGRVVQAHRTGPVVELLKWIRRNRLTAGLVAGFFLVATAGSVAFALFERRAKDELARKNEETEEQRAKAEQAGKEARASREVALSNEGLALRQARRADGNRLAAQALGLAPKQPDLALLLGIEAFDLAPGAQARDALYQALSFLREVRTLKGHDSYVERVAWSPDGAVLASREWGTQAILWDAESGAILHRLDEHEDELTGLAFDPSGARLVTTSHDGTARIWSTATGRCTAVLRADGPRKAVAWASFSPDGLLLATASDDGTARIWDPASRECLRILKGHEGGVHCVRFSPDGAQLATASRDGTVRTWDVATGAPRLVLRVADAARGGFPRIKTAWPEFSVEALWSPGGDRILAQFPPVAEVFDARSGALLASPGGSGARIRRAGWDGSGNLLLLDSHEGGRTLIGIWDLAAGDWASRTDVTRDTAFVTTGSDGRRIWLCPLFSTVLSGFSAATGDREFDLLGHTYQVTDASEGPGGRRLASAGSDGTVRIWDLERADLLRGAADGSRAIRAWTRDGALVLGTRQQEKAGSWTGEIVDTRTGAVLRSLGPADGRSAWSQFADGDRLVLLMAPEGLRVWRLEPFGEVPLPAAARDSSRWMARLSDDGKRLAARREGSGTTIWDLGKPSDPPLVLDDRGREVRDIAWSPDGRRLATANEKAGTATVWDASSGKATRLAGHSAWVFRAAWSPDGRIVATGAMDQTVRLWDPGTGACLARAEGLAKEIPLPCISPDGKVLAVAQYEGVELFDLPDPLPPVLPRRGRIPGSLDQSDPRAWFLPDGRIALLHANGTIHLWTLDPVAEARRRAPRDLTPRERDRYETGAPGRGEGSRQEPETASELGRGAKDLAAKGQFAEALVLLDRAAKLRPRFPATHYQVAAVLAERAATLPVESRERTGDADRAIAELREAVSLGLFRRDPADGPGGVREDRRFEAIRDRPDFEAALSGR